MRTRFQTAVLLAAALLVSSLAIAQEQATRVEIRKATVLYVAPGVVIVQGANGVRKFTPADWKEFKVEKDGQPIQPDQLQKGDIVTATIITKTPPAKLTAEEQAKYVQAEAPASGEMTEQKIIFTEVRKGTVEFVSPDSLLIRTATGMKKFTPETWKDTMVEKDGQMIAPNQLHKGDIVTATFVTKASPAVVIADAKPATKPAASAPAAKPAPAARPAAPAPTAVPAVKSVPPPAPAPAPAAEPAPAKKLPKTASPLPAIGAAGILLLSLAGLLMLARRRASVR